MTYVDWWIGALVTIVGVLTYVLLRITFGWGDRKRDRDELRRSAKRAEGVRK